MFLFFKQKTAYEMRISDWSSDVCSSDLLVVGTRTRSNDYRANGCIIGDLNSCMTFGVPLPTQRFDLTKDLEALFAQEDEDEDERDDLLFSNGGDRKSVA